MNKRKKLGKQMLSFLLAVLLAIEAIPLEVLAVGNNSDDISEVETEIVENEESEVFVISEEVSKREAYVKHFRMSDGSYVAAQYTSPVHFEKDGEWVEYNNTLEEVSAIVESDITAEDEEFLETEEERHQEEVLESQAIIGGLETESLEGEVSNEEEHETLDSNETDLKNKVSDLDIRLSKKTNGKKFVRLEKEGYKLSWYYKNADKVTGQNVSQNDDGDAMTLEQMTSKVLYENVFHEADMEYIIGTAGLKENIILKSNDAPVSYEAEYKVNGLTPVAVDNQTIELRAEDGSIVYSIQAPFMMDAAEEYSDGVTLTLSKVKNNKFTITTTLDEEWLKEEGREFPIIVDPAVETEKKQDIIDSTYIASGEKYHNKNFGGYGGLGVGWDTSGYEYMRTLVKFSLPDLGKGDIVVGASLRLALYRRSFYLQDNDTGNTTMDDQQIDAHVITSSWDRMTVKWDNQPSYDMIVYDYDYIKGSDKEGRANWKQFDITTSVKQWYEDERDNYGIMIKKTIEGGDKEKYAANGKFWSEKQPSGSGAYPAILIQYRNNKGIEDYWTYSAYGIGSAGTAFVNDYTGNLVYELPIASTISETMPIEVCGYYNTYCAGETVGTGVKKYIRTSIGKGFRLNVQQNVYKAEEFGLTGDMKTRYPFIYVDGEGTEHYFQKVTEDGKTVYKDEDGLGLLLTDKPDKSATYQITDKAGYNYYFNAKGNLISWYNTNGQRARLDYMPSNTAAGLEDRSRIHTIKDGVDHVYTFSYYKDSSGKETDYVHTITDQAGRVITFVQENGLLKKITYSDGSETYLSYDSNEVLSTVTSHEGYRLAFTYSDTEKGTRVEKVQEFAANDEDFTNFSSGLMVTFDRSIYNTTIIRSAGNDSFHIEEEASCGDDDIVTTMQFDDLGRTISVQSSYGNGEEIGAGSYQYTSGEKEVTTLGSKNKVAGTGSLGKNTENLLINGSGEGDTFWDYEVNGEPGFSAETVGTSTKPYFGNRSLCIQSNQMDAEGTAAYSQTIELDVAEAKYYSFSAYVKTEDIEYVPFENAGSDTRYGAYVQMDVKKQNAEGQYVSSGTTRSAVEDRTSDESINNGWRRLDVKNQLSAGQYQITVKLILENVKGKVYFDGMQLEEGNAPNAFNLLLNSSFEMINSGIPMGWSPANTSYQTSGGMVIEGATDAQAKAGENALRISGNAETTKGFSQTVLIEGNEKDTYIVSGWACGYPINSTFHKDDSGNENALFEIGVKVHYECYDEATGTTTSVTQKKESAKFNTTITGWQYATIPIIVEYKGAAEGKKYTPKSIEIIPSYEHQANYVIFDHLMLAKEPVQTYAYDSEGNVTSVKASAEQKNDMSYEGNKLKEYIDLAGYKTTFHYDENSKNLTSMVSARGLTTSYTYNAGGSVVSTEIKSSTENEALRSDNAYTNESNGILAGAYLASTSDQDGNETSYSYNMSTGTLKSVTDPSGTTTSYTHYGTDERLATVSSGGTEVVYEYETRNGAMTNKLSEITVKGTDETDASESYSFVYDKWGNVTETHVGDTALVRNFYDDNGRIDTVNYADGYKKSYYYNDDGTLGDITEFDQDDEQQLRVTWKYDANGTVLETHNWSSNDKYNYEYDSLGRFVRERVHNTTGTGVKGITEFAYDERNNISRVASTVGGMSTTQNYHYGIIKKKENPEESEEPEEMTYEEELEETTAEYAKDNLPTLYELQNMFTMPYDYDGLNRLTQKRLITGTNDIYSNYLYKDAERGTSENGTVYETTQVEMEFLGSYGYQYFYDEMGNITKVKGGARSVNDPNYGNRFLQLAASYVDRTYEYDELNQMTRENNFTSKKSKTFSYDAIGNIQNVKEYAYTHGDLGAITKVINYTYGNDGKNGWNNLLTGVDLNGNGTLSADETISYDTCGNPLNYLGAALGWDGRVLSSYTKGNTNIDYLYDADGMRVRKTVNGVRTDFYYANGNLYYQATYDGDGTVANALYFFYDSYNNLTAIIYTEPDSETSGSACTYYVQTNQQGDVVMIYNDQGNKVVGYTYDAWGNLLKMTDVSVHDIGELNPIRYRGYYYDEETGFYYLKNRYYNPEVGRFISPDTTNALCVASNNYNKNMYSYCDNNPVIRIDVGGDVWQTALIGACISLGSSWLSAVVYGENFGWDDAAIAIFNGVVAGTKGHAATIVAVVSFGHEVYKGISDGDNLKEIIVNSATEAAISAMWVSNNINWGKNVTDIVAETVVDAVLGTGGDLVTPATSKLINKAVDAIESMIPDPGYSVTRNDRTSSNDKVSFGSGSKDRLR